MLLQASHESFSGISNPAFCNRIRINNVLFRPGFSRNNALFRTERIIYFSNQLLQMVFCHGILYHRQCRPHF